MQSITLVTVVCVIKEMPRKRSSSNALLVKCDDGKKYVLKHKKNGQSVQPCNILIAELTCYLIAKQFGLNIPDMSLIWINEQILRATEDKKVLDILTGSVGINIGSVFFKDAEPVEGSSDLEKALNEMHFQIIYSFDEYVYNIDRMPDNPNLLISRDKREIWVIDHSAAIWPAKEINADLRTATHFSKEHILFPYLGHNFSQFAKLTATIYDTVIKDILAIIPEEWFNEEMTREYLGEFLSVRRDNIRTIIKEAVYG